jgi:hypothetical protein
MYPPLWKIKANTTVKREKGKREIKEIEEIDLLK